MTTMTKMIPDNCFNNNEQGDNENREAKDHCGGEEEGRPIVQEGECLETWLSGGDAKVPRGGGTGHCLEINHLQGALRPDGMGGEGWHQQPGNSRQPVAVGEAGSPQVRLARL